MKELIALAKARPGELNYSSSGSGSGGHLFGELLKSRAGVNIVHVPYNGVVPAVTAVMTGEVGVGLITVASGAQQIRAGRPKALGITSPQRSAIMPNVPTVAESGLPGFEIVATYGMYSPSSIPAAILARLNGELQKIVAQTDVRERFAALGIEPSSSSPDELASVLKNGKKGEMNMASIHDGTSTVSLLATGDCGPVHGPKDGFPLERYTELVRPTLAAADLRVGHCERQYSLRGESMYGDSPHGRQPPEMARIFSDCRFDVVTIASNHMYDYGPDALLDTRALLESKEIRVAGAGRNLEHAREPAIVERKAIKLGFVAYCSVIPPGGEARANKIGVSPLRVKTYYEPRGPHAPVRVLTEPDESDLRMILDDIRALRERVDIVIPVFHWGVIWAPRIIADYQVTVAHAAIDAGADLVLGHHAHVPKAIEVYKGKAIFYCLSNFCMTKGFPKGPWLEPPWMHGALRNHTDQDPAYPLLPYGKDAKRSLLAKAIFSKSGVTRVSYLPMMIDTQYRPEILCNGDPRFTDITSYMEWASEGFPHRFTVDGDEVVIAES